VTQWLRYLALALALVTLVGAPVRAQVGGPAGDLEVAEASDRVQFRLYFMTDVSSIGAPKTFDAVFGTSRVIANGAGGEVLGLWKNTFARVLVSGASLEGSRVVVVNDEPISLGIPLTVTMRPIEIGGGWRFEEGTPEWIVPYAGAGFVRIAYNETSDFAMPGDNVSLSLDGLSIFGGVDVRLWRLVAAGVEGQYRKVSGLGTGGVSQAFGERELGGFTFRFLIGIRQ
jgi:hypothetical protein